MSKSELEATFLHYWRLLAHDLPEPEREYRFHPVRRFRWDFAWPKRKVAVEIQGGTWMRTKMGRSGGHAHPSRLEKDAEKYNLGQQEGWSVYLITGQMLDRDPAYCIAQVAAALDGEETLPFTDVE
jgi:very-short-patch-repair endonuclease